MDLSEGNRKILGLLTLFGFFLSVHAQCDSLLHCLNCNTNTVGGVLQCLTCEEGYAQSEGATGCCSRGCTLDQFSFHLCNTNTGKCTYGCRSGFVGDTCVDCKNVIERCEDCKHLEDNKSLPVHCITCATDFYPTSNKQQCCPMGCDSCNGQVCTSCKSSYFLYNDGCDTCGNNCKPPSDGSARCDSVSGECNLGCLEGWHGLKCNVLCDLSRCDECTYDVPRQNLTCLDCEAGFYGPYCVACNSNCGSTGNSEICMQDGTCLGSCKPGYRGNKCDVACAGSSDRPSMTRLSLLCIFLLALIARTYGFACHQRWTLIYANSGNGTTVYGEKKDLIKATLSGADVRIFIPSWGPGGYLTSVQNTQTIRNNVCAQALFHVSKASYDTFQEVPYFWFVNLCSTGHVHMARYFIGNHVSAGINGDYVDMQWYIRRYPDPVYTHTQDGTVIRGSVRDVIYAIEAGADIRIVDRQLGYGVRMDNLEVSFDRTVAAGQSLWHVSERMNGPNLEFQGDDYWWFSVWSTDGTVDVSRWNVGEHVKRGNSSMQQSMNWYADSCWQMAYKHDAQGQLEDGSLQLLRLAVETGHRIKVLIDGAITVEPDQINVRGGHINAEILSLASKQDLKSFTDDVFWDWRVLTTTGTETSEYFNVGEYFNRGNTIKKKPMTWFIDTRTWNRVLVNDKDGTVLAGSKQQLIDAILLGAEVRYKLTFTSNAITHQADNLEISADGNVGAMHVRSVSLKFTPGSRYEVTFQNSPYWWFTIVSTTGKVDISRWTVGEHVNRRHTHLFVKVEWFVSL